MTRRSSRRSAFRIWPLLLSGVCGAAGATHGATAAEVRRETLALDSARSQAGFEVRVMWLIGVRGRFGTLRGTIDIDRFRGNASVNARIDVNDVHMRSASNEAWVKSAEFFDAEHYPQIQFVSDSFPLVWLKSGGQIEGMLTIRGVTRHANFDLAASACPDAIARACPTEAGGTIRRSDFGMHSRRGALSDKVQLDFSIYVLPVAEAAR
ncbi:MAG: YceI family protein [Rudaea sp.]|nr:YceI family protein [Rudaea sp.]